MTRLQHPMSPQSPGFAGIVGLTPEAEALLRERRKWSKKRRQIDQLKQRQKEGEALDAQQREKILAEANVLARIAAAERRLRAMNIDPANLSPLSPVMSGMAGSQPPPLNL